MGGSAGIYTSRLIRAGMCGLQVGHSVLVCPAGIGCALLQGQHTVQGTHDGGFQVLHSQYLIALYQEVYVLGNYVIIQRNERRIVLLSVEGVVVFQRIALRPASYRILAFQYETDSLFQRCTIGRVVFLYI